MMPSLFLNTLVADDRAMVARSSAAKVLTMQVKIVIHEEQFKLPAVAKWQKF